MRALLLRVSVVAVIAAGACTRAPAPTMPVTAAANAVALPPLDLTLIGGAPWSPAIAAGKVLLIDVWASWCAPCRVGLRRADALAAADKNLAVIGLSLDEDDAAVRTFLAQVPVRIDIARVPAAVLTAAPLEISRLPALILVDVEGRIRWLSQDVQEADYDAVADAIATLQAEARARP